ncbi:MAG: class C sortase [Eggerthellaceae bacterium]|nr:class C sortase [Eggerthellaceae bacterium]
MTIKSDRPSTMDRLDTNVDTNANTPFVQSDMPCKKKSHAGKARRYIATTFFSLMIIVGLSLVLYPIIANIQYQLGVSNIVTTYDDSVGSYAPEDLDRMWADAYAYNAELGDPTIRDPFGYTDIVSPLDRYYDILNPDGSGMMGYVNVPSVGINLPIYHATSEDVLQKGAGHIATTALPIDGTSIHPVITGHTGIPDKVLFTNLDAVHIDDIFRIKVLNKTFSYKVSRIDVVQPDDTNLLQPVSGKDEVTLLTCTPYGINSERLLVTGIPTTEDTDAPVRGVPLAILPWLITLLCLAIVGLLVDGVIRRRALRMRNQAFAYRDNLTVGNRK